MTSLNDTQIITATNSVTKLVNESGNFGSGLVGSSLQMRTINLASDLLLSISNRNINEESEDVVNSFMDSVNQVLNQPIDTLRKTQNSYNSSKK